MDPQAGDVPCWRGAGISYPLAEFDGSLTTYTRASDTVVSAGTSQVLHDAQESVIGRWSAGAVFAAATYDAWGTYNSGSDTPASAPTMGYTGHLWDSDAGLVYAKARWYAPQIGRFASTDPYPGTIKIPQPLNGFTYAHENPTRYRDPSGAIVPLVIVGVALAMEAIDLAVVTSVAAAAGHVIYQEVKYSRDLGTADYGAAGKFGVGFGVATGVGALTSPLAAGVAGDGAAALGLGRFAQHLVAGAGGAFGGGFAGDISLQTAEIGFDERTHLSVGRAALVGLFGTPFGLGGGAIAGGVEALDSLGAEVADGAAFGFQSGVADILTGGSGRLPTGGFGTSRHIGLSIAMSDFGRGIILPDELGEFGVVPSGWSHSDALARSTTELDELAPLTGDTSELANIPGSAGDLQGLASRFEASSFEGRRVFLNTLDVTPGAPARVDSKFVHAAIRARLAKGATNLDLMRAGFAPIGSDGRPLNLHHLLGQEPGPMVELLGSTHSRFSRALHGLIESGRSFRRNPGLEAQYEVFRARYWKWRASLFSGAE